MIRALLRSFVALSLFVQVAFTASGSCSNYQLGLLHKTYDLSDRVQYIDDHAEFETVLATYQDKEIGRGYTDTVDGTTNPFSSQQDDYLSTFTGYIDIPSSGDYEFAIDGDDGVELLIDGNVVVGWYGAHGACNCQTHKGTVNNLSAGKHTIEFRHHERGGSALYRMQWKKPGDTSFVIVPEGNLFHCAPKVPDVEYKFNECSWNGIANEVKDSTNNYNGTATNATTTNSEKVLTRSGDFSTDSSSDYITLSPEILNGASDFSVMMWIKAAPSSQQSLISMANSSQNNEALMFVTNNGTTFSPHIKGTRTDIAIPNITDDTWHHLVWTRDGTSGQNCLVIDGNITNKYCGNNARTGALAVTGMIVAQDQDSVNGGFDAGQDFQGYMDEVKIYREIVTDSDISMIYENESRGYTYDGLSSGEVFCSSNICSNHTEKLNIATYDLSNTPYKTNYADDHNEFQTIVDNYATDTYLFGSGLTANIDSTSYNSNPFHEGTDDYYLTVIDGFIYIPSDGDYTFMVNGDDAEEVLIDGIVVSSWYGGHGASSDPTNQSAITKNTVYLQMGYHELEFHHQEVAGSDSYEFYWLKPGDSSYQIVPSSNLFHCIPYPPLFEYRFDECSDYNGTAGEVVDSSGNGFHGNTSGSVTLNKNSGVMNYSIEFGLESDVNQINAVIASKSPKDIGDKGAISFWYKSKKAWNSSDGVMLVDATKGDKYFFLGLQSDGRLKLWAEDSNDRDFQSYTNTAFTFSSSEWVHITMSWDYTNKRFKLYVNGQEQSLNTSPNFTGGMPELKPIHIGDISENYTQNATVYNGVKNSANGYFDEFRAYQGELKAQDVLKIYEFESDGKNFDGSTREKPFCIAVQQCFADTFDRNELGELWQVITKTNFTPQIIQNRLVLTDLHGSIASAVMLVGKFPSADNYVQIEFDGFAYGGSGADGMTVALSDATIVEPLVEQNLTNIAGAYGGSLGYAQRTGIEGFKGGWLGIALDEYGNFSNATDGRVGGTGATRDSVSIRGRGIKNSSTNLWSDGYEFIKGTSTLDPQVDQNFLGYKYRISIDTRDGNTLIKVERDTDGSGYKTLIDWFDASQIATSPEQFKFALTASTGGSTNYHVIDNLVIKATGCGTLGQIEETPSYFFDAWDSDKNINLRNITTKKSLDSFSLTIASLDATNTALENYTGSVCARIVDNSLNALSSWNKLQFNATTTMNSDFTVANANKQAKVQIVWKDDVNENCPLSNETNSTLSTDNFAIRPDKFELTLPSLGYAADGFSFSAKATDSAGVAVEDYNETLNNSFQISSSPTITGCDGALSVSNFSFSDGLASSVDANYSDVGDINVTISEIEGSEFASIDTDDTLATERLITPYTASFTVQPYELNITNLTVTTSTGSSWIYMADVNDMSFDINTRVVANDKNHNLVNHFTSACYAKDLQLKYTFDTSYSDSGVMLSYKPLNFTFVDGSKAIEDINKTIQLSKNDFTTSSLDFSLSINVDRLYNKPYNPINIVLNDINFLTVDEAKDENNATSQITSGMQNDFYFGKIKTNDITTNQLNVNNNLEIDVFCSSNCPSSVASMQQASLSWYKNSYDSYSSITFFPPKTNLLLSSPNINTIALTNIVGVGSGVLTFDIQNSSDINQKAVVHVNSPAWLWYSKYNPFDLNVSTSDCSMHYCFEYSYESPNNAYNIKTGEYKGTTIGEDYNISKKVKGVKRFR